MCVCVCVYVYVCARNATHARKGGHKTPIKVSLILHMAVIA